MSTEKKTLIDCPICYTCIDNQAVEGYKLGCITNCGHHFHLGCLHRWTYKEEHDDCPYCRSTLDHDLLDQQYALRLLLRMKQRQPTNRRVDNILFQMKHDCINTLNWFCEPKAKKGKLYWTQKIPRVPEEKPRNMTKEGRTAANFPKQKFHKRSRF